MFCGVLKEHLWICLGDHCLCLMWIGQNDMKKVHGSSQTFREAATPWLTPVTPENVAFYLSLFSLLLWRNSKTFVLKLQDDDEEQQNWQRGCLYCISKLVVMFIKSCVKKKLPQSSARLWSSDSSHNPTLWASFFNARPAGEKSPVPWDSCW